MTPSEKEGDPPQPSLLREGVRSDATFYSDGGEQGRESGNNHLDDCLDDVFPIHSLRLRLALTLRLRIRLILASLLDFLGADERSGALEGHAPFSFLITSQ